VIDRITSISFLRLDKETVTRFTIVKKIPMTVHTGNGYLRDTVVTIAI
jgi:hypothetical protein